MTVKNIYLVETRIHWAVTSEHPSFQFSIEKSVLSHSVGKEINHQQMTYRDAMGTQ